MFWTIVGAILFVTVVLPIGLYLFMAIIGFILSIFDN